MADDRVADAQGLDGAEGGGRGADGGILALTYRRTNHKNLHVRGYKEEGTTTTPFDMAVRNELDRFHLVTDVVDRVPKLAAIAAYAKQAMRDELIEHREYIAEHGDDRPEIREWRWEA